MPHLASFRLPVLLLAVVCVASPVPMWAQKDAGRIVGTVKDQTGAIVANAKVTVSDVERGIHLETTTNESGEYVASPLRVGRYTVTVEHPGFKKSVTPPVDLDVQQRIALNIALQVGQISESIEVTAATPLLETETSELGQVVDNKRMANLPLNGRNFAQLALLTAGTAPSEPGARDEGGFGFSANGEAKLVLLVGSNRTVGIVKEILGIQLFVAQKFVSAAVKLVGAGLDRGVDDGAVAPAKFGAVGVGLDLEFFNRFHRRLDDVVRFVQQVRQVGIVVHAIQ